MSMKSGKSVGTKCVVKYINECSGIGSRSINVPTLLYLYVNSESKRMHVFPI